MRIATFCEPSIPNTDAESVDDIVAASSSDGRNAKCIFVHSIPDSSHMNPPVMKAVMSTPAVESAIPGIITGRMAEIFVPMPPENSMMQSATMPMLCAVCMSLNCMPAPSVPNPIPTSRKMRRMGRPIR